MTLTFLRHKLQDEVTSKMPIVIVGAFEVVHIEHHDRQFTVVTLGNSKLTLSQFKKMMPEFISCTSKLCAIGTISYALKQNNATAYSIAESSRNKMTLSTLGKGSHPTKSSRTRIRNGKKVPTTSKMDCLRK